MGGYIVHSLYTAPCEEGIARNITLEEVAEWSKAADCNSVR